MRLICMLAEGVQANEAKFYAFGGGLHYVMTSGFPAAIPMLAVLAEMLVEPDEAGREHRLVMRGEDPNNAPFFPDVEVNFGPLQLLPGHPEVPAYHMLAANLRGAPLTVPGTYTFIISVDDVELGRISILCFGPPSGPAPETQ